MGTSEYAHSIGDVEYKRAFGAVLGILIHSLSERECKRAKSKIHIGEGKEWL